MVESEFVSYGRDMIYLAACSFHGRIPDRERVASMNLKAVYRLAKFHSMQAIVYISITKCIEKYGNDIIDPDLLNKWRSDFQTVVKKLVMFDIEREGLCKFMSDRGIRYLCLKGVVLQHYYPTLGMRQMSDNDILVDEEFCEMIRDYMTEHGYTTHSFAKGCHDTYFRGFLNFEIHRKLFSTAVRTRRGHEYYSDVWKMLKEGERPYEMIFSDEDFYVYFIYHAYKHYATAGCGVRTLMDIYAYLSRNSSLDMKYIEKQLSILGISDYERNSRALAFEIFSPNTESEITLTDELSKMLSYYITSGTFGTEKKMVENDVNLVSGGEEVTTSVKIKYILRRIFPDMSYYRGAYPRASRWIIPIPFIWLMRIFRSIGRHERLAREADTVRKMK